MIEIRHLIAESGANKFGTCNCCGKSSSEDPHMISVKFSYYGHGTLICLCDDCKKKLMEVLSSANCSEFPNNSDTISRQAAIAKVNEYASIWMEYTEGMSKDEIAQAALDSAKQTMIRILSELPSAQPEQLEQCPIYGGMCAYPSDQCYDCPRHAGAKMGVTS